MHIEVWNPYHNKHLIIYSEICPNSEFLILESNCDDIFLSAVHIFSAWIEVYQSWLPYYKGILNRKKMYMDLVVQINLQPCITEHRSLGIMR